MILLISANFPPEPVVAALLSKDLADILSEKYKVTVLTPRPSRPAGYTFPDTSELKKAYNQVILDSYICPASTLSGRMREYYSFGKHAARYIRDNHKKIRCCYVSSWPLFGQYLIMRELSKYSIPAVTHIQDVYPESLAGKIPLLDGLFIRCLLPLDKYILKNSYRVVAISPKMKSFIVETRSLDEERVKVISNWQNEKKFIECGKSAGSSSLSRPFTFMFLGSMNRSSSLSLIIKAFQHSGLTNARLVLAGSGPEKDLLMTMAASDKHSNIEFIDAPAAMVPEIQKDADVLLLNLKKGIANFSLPSKLTAYMFSARPVIACLDESSDAADIIRNAECGWVVGPGDEKRLSEMMRIAASVNGNELGRMGENGFRYAMENFSSGMNAKKLASVVEEALN